MKFIIHCNSLLLVLFLVLFTSCTSVYFDQPQPKNGVVLKSVPLELQGKWFTREDEEPDSFYITSDGLEFVYVKTDSLNNITSVEREKELLSDSLILCKAGKYYVVNQLSDWGWEVLIIHRQKNGDIYWYNPNTSPFFGEWRGLKVIKVVRTINGAEKNDKSLLNKEGERIETVYYQGQFRIKDIKKVLKPKNVFWIFENDGSIQEPTTESE